MSTGGKVLFGFVAGAMAGAVAALLLAPQSGEETREDLMEEADRTYRKARVNAHRLKKQVQQKIDEYAERAGEDDDE